uniref:Peptidase_M41 domain-containing protein n=1 Tax=Meloidogyne hapla TaxID=6305 RepID=A0A1I8BNJ2_MELHA
MSQHNSQVPSILNIIGSSRTETDRFTYLVSILFVEPGPAIVQLTDEEKRRVAIHEAGHCYCAFMLNVCVKKVTIIPSGQFLGHTLLDHGQKTIWTRDEKETLMTLLLAGRASEVHFFESASTLVEDDFTKLKQIANSMFSMQMLSDNFSWVVNDSSNSNKESREEEIRQTCLKCNEQAKILIKNNHRGVEKTNFSVLKNIYQEECLRANQRLKGMKIDDETNKNC